MELRRDFSILQRINLHCSALCLDARHPVVFSIMVEAMPEDSNTLAGPMAIVGGAFLPPLMGLVADYAHSVQNSFLVPLAAMLYISSRAAEFRGMAPGAGAAQ